jgi:hypothetical protein
LAINFFLKEKYKKKGRKKEKEIGMELPFWPKWGGRTTPFLEPPPWPVWGWFMAKEVVRSPPKGQKEKKKEKKEKKREWILVFWGWSNLLFLFFVFWPFWVVGPPLGHGGGLTTPRTAVGVAPVVGWLKPSLGQNGVSTPDFFFFIFFIIIFFYIFLLKKLMVKTTSFWIGWEDEMVKTLRGKIGILVIF